MELERIELSPSRLKVERLTIRPQFQKLGAPGWNRTNCLTIKNRLLILMSFERIGAGAGSRTLRQRKLGTEGWNRTNVEGFKDLRPATERPRHGTPGWIRTSVYRFRRAMPESPRPQARSHLVPG